jgi:hypothetical protein
MKTKKEEKRPMDIDTAKLSRAFDLVTPAPNPELCALYGLTGGRRDWKDRIHAIVTDDELEAANVTIADVEEAIAHYTATIPRVTRERIKGTLRVTYIDGCPGYMVQADGYRAGPAGDR